MTAPLRLEPLTAAAFEPFGTLVDLAADSGAGRYDRRAAFEDLRGGLDANVALIRAPAQALPQRIDVLERHPHSTQIFAPLGMAGRFLVVVAPDGGGAPDVGGARAFLCEGARAIAYAPGTWHHPLLSLVPCRFLMLIHEDGSAADTEWFTLDAPLPLAAQTA